MANDESLNTLEDLNDRFRKISIKKLKKLSYNSSTMSADIKDLKLQRKPNTSYDKSIGNNTIESPDILTKRSKFSISIHRISSLYKNRRGSVKSVSSCSRTSTLVVEKEKNLGFNSTALLDMSEDEIFGAYYLPPTDQPGTIENSIMSRKAARDLNRKTIVSQVDYIKNRRKRRRKLLSCCCF